MRTSDSGWLAGHGTFRYAGNHKFINTPQNLDLISTLGAPPGRDPPDRPAQPQIPGKRFGVEEDHRITEAPDDTGFDETPEYQSFDDALEDADLDEADEPKPVRLNILPYLKDIDLMADLSIVLEGMPVGAQLSAGKNNWDGMVLPGYGHGIGHFGHEWYPCVVEYPSDCDTEPEFELQPNYIQMIALEANRHGVAGFRLERPLLITPDGNELLSAMPIEPTILDADCVCQK